ncbi:hypothetical protein D3C85_1607910 [compost metagenome]
MQVAFIHVFDRLDFATAEHVVRQSGCSRQIDEKGPVPGQGITCDLNGPLLSEKPLQHSRGRFSRHAMHVEPELWQDRGAGELTAIRF